MKNRPMQFLKKNTLFALLILFTCIALGVFAYLNSDTPDRGTWHPIVTYLPSTPTNTLIPEGGWWTTVHTPTSKP